MRAFTAIAASVLALLAGQVSGRAIPAPDNLSARDFGGHGGHGEKACLSSADASYLVNSFALLVNTTFNYTLAGDIISPTFNDYSDGFSFLSGEPYGVPTFTNLTAFEAGSAAQPTFPFGIESIDAVACTSLAYRWIAYPSTLGPVRGITIDYVSQGNNTANGANGWQLQTQYVEFNSAQFALDTGGNCTA